MSEILYNILMCCQTDLNDGLMQVKSYLKNSDKRKTTTILTVEIIKAISAVVSTIHSLEHPDSEYMEIILDTLLFATRNKIRVYGRIEFELGNLTLKILTCIEHNVKFHILFCKLLSLINLLFSRSINVWQLLARPVFNLFINKKVEHAYLEEALKELNNVSKKLKPTELVNIIKQNHNILQGFSMLAREYGDFVIQMNILELLLLFTGHDRKIMKSLICSGNQETSELLKKLNFSDFRKDSRIFLNAFNKSLGLGKKVFSLNSSVFYLGNAKLSPPSAAEGIWIDLNQDSKRISIFYADFLPNSRSPPPGILHLPVEQVEGMKLKFSKLSNEDCCCFIMKIRITSEMYHFTEGSEVICKAFLSLNQQKYVVEFVRAIEELSQKVQAYKGIKTNEIPNSGSSFTENSTAEQIKSPPRKSNRNKFSISSPIIFVTGDKKENKDARDLSQMPSSIFSLKPSSLNTNEIFCSNPNTKTDRNWSEEKIHNRITLSGESNLQVNQISSSVFESQKLVLGSGFNPSLLTQASTKNADICNQWRVPDDIQFDIFNSKKGVRSTLSPEIQDLRENCPHYRSLKTYGDNSEKHEETNQKKKNYSRRIYEEWANSEDSFSSEFCLIKQKNVENVEYSENCTVNVCLPVPPEKKLAGKGSKFKLTHQHKQSKPRGREKTGEIRSASLLDPNGYSYKRWQLQTTSERSNFWLNKLKETENKASKPLKDIFNFSDEEDHSDGSNVFRKKKIGKVKECILDGNKTKTENKKKIGPKAKDDKLLKNNTRKTVETGNDLQSKTTISHKSKISNKKMNNNEEEMMKATSDTKAYMSDIGNEFIQKQDLPLGELQSNRSSKRYSSDNYSKGVLNPIPIMAGSEKENEVEEEKPKRKKRRKDESFLPTARKTKKSVKPISFDVKLREMESEMWNNMYQFFKETRKREEKELTKYFKNIEEVMERLAEEEAEVQRRLIRFDKCVKYLNLGTSLYEIHEESQKDMENVLERLNIVDRSGKIESRMNKFLEDIEEKLISKVENYINKKLREFKLSLLERYLSNNAL